MSGLIFLLVSHLNPPSEEEKMIRIEKVKRQNGEGSEAIITLDATTVNKYTPKYIYFCLTGHKCGLTFIKTLSTKEM